jgi:hypothetical protein
MKVRKILKEILYKGNSFKRLIFSREFVFSSSLPDLTITKMVEVLKTQIQSGASPSRITALGWVHHLFECLRDKVIIDQLNIL